ncbi:TonB-dependent receptor [Porticoccaceae bacterium LTM1]|nr:TonB-dependent receptor [Porticoccaceae bacterium LTM1]
MNNRTVRINRKPLVASVSLVLLGMASFGYAAEVDSRSLDIQIEMKHADTALMELADISGFQIIIPTDIGADSRLVELSGEYTFEEALEKMLKGSGLTYKFISDDSVVISLDEAKSDVPRDETVDELVVVGSRVVTRNRANTVSPTLVYDSGYFERFEPLTLNDMLKRVPGVYFDKLFNAPDVSRPLDNDDIETEGPKLRNLDAKYTQILVNGKSIAGIDFGSGPNTLLSTIPANDIKEIQVIRSPTADIDSVGIGMTLNVILKDGKSLSQEARDSWRVGASYVDGDINHVGGITVSGGGEEFFYSVGLTSQERSRVLTNKFMSGSVSKIDFGDIYNGEIISESITDITSRDQNLDRSLNANIGFYLNSYSTLTVSANLFKNDLSGFSVEETSSESRNELVLYGVPLDSTPVEDGYERISRFNQEVDAYSVGLSYDMDFDNLNWASSILYNKSDVTRDSYIQDGYVYGTNRENFRDGNSKVIQAKSELTYNFFESGKFKFGVDYNKNSNVNNYSADIIDFGYTTSVYDTSQTAERKTLFASYEWSINDYMSLLGGGRYSSIDLSSSSTDQYVNFSIFDLSGFVINPEIVSSDHPTKLDAEYSSFSPNLHFRWDFADGHMLRVSLAKTERRPNISEFDPTKDIKVETASFGTRVYARVGNRALKPEESLGFDLGYDWRFDGGILGVNLFRRFIDNAIVREDNIPFENFESANPMLAGEVGRLYAYLQNQAIINNVPLPLLNVSLPFNSDVEMKVHGAELDLSMPLNFISETAQLYFNATYSSQSRTGELSNRSGAVNLTYDHELESLGLSYGASVNWITKDSRETKFSSGGGSTSVSELDPNVEVFVEKVITDNVLVRLSVENLLDAEQTALSANYPSSNPSSFSFYRDSSSLTQSSRRVLLTFRGRF